jgi:hypothetical protein
LITLEVIHQFVEVLDRYFGNVCELDLIFNFHKVMTPLKNLETVTFATNVFRAPPHLTHKVVNLNKTQTLSPRLCEGLLFAESPDTQTLNPEPQTL